ncbi:hypothetical protein [Alicyclobacillus dauci]|uniref:Uncharacterized protein n=1 Tax=Alicyclobacillus dauci TaxID=1475485 RepID=A0ABY6Z0K4_9BACL|nr:hypothetical protein [Alicyclobacillus dauci]WAH36390.1 hypothetical protein NZD86_19525 [Alicyclobacillus dauci]
MIWAVAARLMRAAKRLGAGTYGIAGVSARGADGGPHEAHGALWGGLRVPLEARHGTQGTLRHRVALRHGTGAV